MKLTITLNFSDETEIDSIEAECADLADLPRAVEQVLDENDGEGYSSLVIVVLPH